MTMSITNHTHYDIVKSFGTSCTFIYNIPGYFNFYHYYMCATVMTELKYSAMDTKVLFTTHNASNHPLDEGNYWIEGIIPGHFSDQIQIIVEAAPKSGEQKIVSVYDPSRLAGFFDVFPNPTEGTFTISLNKPVSESLTTIEVYSIHGQQIKHREVQAVHHHVFSLEGQKPGIYLIRVMKGDQVGIERLIKR